MVPGVDRRVSHDLIMWRKCMLCSLFVVGNNDLPSPWDVHVHNISLIVLHFVIDEVEVWVRSRQERTNMMIEISEGR